MTWQLALASSNDSAGAVPFNTQSLKCSISRQKWFGRQAFFALVAVFGPLENDRHIARQLPNGMTDNKAYVKR